MSAAGGDPGRSIFWLDHTGKISPLRPTPGFYSGLSFSSDGKPLVFTTDIDAGHRDLWLQDVQRNTLVRLTSLPGMNESPVWSGDGKYILFGSFYQPNAGLYWVRSDGAGERQQVAEAESGVASLPTSFSPDGKRVAFQRGDSFIAMEVWTAVLEGAPDHPLLGKREPFQRARGFPMPAFSPDGRWVVYSSRETGTPEIYVQLFPGAGGKVPVSTGGGQFPIWSPNGHELFFYGSDRRIMVVDYTARADSFLAGKPRVWSPQQVLLRAGGGPYQPYALAPDGKRFAVMLYPDGTAELHNPLHLIFLLNFSDELRRRVPPE